MSKSSAIAFPSLVIVMGWCTCLSAQDDLKPGRLSTDIRKSLEPGVLVEYYSNDDVRLDSSVQRVPAIFLQPQEPVSPFVAARNVRIRMAGYLKLKLKGEYRFSLVGNGSVKISINGNKLIEESGDFTSIKPVPQDLVKGYNLFEVSYTPPAEGNAQLRVYWENESFEIEPIPPTVFLYSPFANIGIGGSGKTESATGLFADHQYRSRGRELVLKHNCLKCHQSESLHPTFQQRDTPNLKIAAARINRDWLENWLSNPHAMRNEISMPAIFQPENDKQDIVDLAGYLMSIGDGSGSSSNSKSSQTGDSDQGGNDFENVGCVGCHHFEEPGFEDEYNRISLFYTAAKFKKGKLAEFLQDSRQHYRWSRMPKFRLNASQANDLEAFIRSESKGSVEAIEVDKSDPKRGKSVFVANGCAQCHSGVVEEKDASNYVATSFAGLKTGLGCLAKSPAENKESRRTPDFRFDEEQKKALNQLVKAKSEEAFSRLNLSLFANRNLKEMRCTTCHDLDDEQATLPYIIEEEGAVGLPPNRVPMLTYAGEKLLPAWSEQLLAGKLPYRVREHFRVQMPGFPERGSAIARGLSQSHGFEAKENSLLIADVKQIEKGKAVAAMDTGLSCNRCHAIADKKPNAAFDAQSTNLIYAAQRLRKEYYLRWMFNPLRIDKQTKMPKFSEDRKSTSLSSIDKGDARKQFEALWQYLNHLKPKD